MAINEQLVGNYVDGSDRARILNAVKACVWRGWGKTWKSTVRIVGRPGTYQTCNICLWET